MYLGLQCVHFFFVCFLIWFGMNLKAFFQRWWVTQSVEMQERVRKLVESGQLEFVYASSNQPVLKTCLFVLGFWICC